MSSISPSITIAHELSTADVQLLRQLATERLTEVSRAWLALNEDDRRRGQAALDLIIGT